MTSVENVRFQLRNGTSTQWANANTVLLAGEPGFDTTNKILKIGDGTNLWSALQSFNTGSTGSVGSIGSTANLVIYNPATETIYGGLDSGSGIIGGRSINLGLAAGQTGQGNYSLAIGFQAGRFNQGSSIALGYFAGSNNQRSDSIAIGSSAANTNQQSNCIAIGNAAGRTNQTTQSIAIGNSAGNTGQGLASIAIGNNAGKENQGRNCIAIGDDAGAFGQENNCIAIGNQAGSSQLFVGTFPFINLVRTTQAANTIILNGTGSNLNGPSGQTGSLFIAPIRSDPTQTLPLCYNPSTFEIVRGSVGSGSGSGPQGIQGVTGAQGPTGNTIFNPVTQTVFIGNGSSGSTGCINIGVGVGGSSPGVSGQGNNSIAIGFDSGGNQKSNCVSIGTFASGGQNSVSLGFQAGYINQGSNCIALGYYSGRGVVNHQPNNTIILNATGLEVDGVSGQTGSCYVAPIRSLSGASTANQGYAVLYNPVTKELYIA